MVVTELAPHERIHARLGNFNWNIETLILAISGNIALAVVVDSGPDFRCLYA